MTTKSDLEAAYKKLFGAAIAVASSIEANDAFEVYVLSLVLSAAQKEGGVVSFASTAGIGSPTPLIFRTSPGYIYSKAYDYSHGLISFPNGEEYEAHVGVYVEGGAKVLHECDVSVVKAAEGAFCRAHHVHPKRASVVLSVECKFYTVNLGIALGRQFIGVTTDLGLDGRYFVTNTGGKSVAKLLAHHRREQFQGLSPLDLDKEQQLEAMFRSRFRALIAKTS
jgi:hypothetical protein